MATIEEGIYALLNTNPAMRALAFTGTDSSERTASTFLDTAGNVRAYPGTIAQDAKFPALGFARAGGSRGVTMSGAENLPRTHFDFSVASTIYQDGVVIINAVIALLDGFASTLPNGVSVKLAQVTLDPHDMFDDAARCYVRYCTIEFWFTEP